ncbi:MAG: hypothetical protein ISQ32_02950 [Rickettsiales bacterium]|nr:hypothetical protein [Rickettsiales bacterium]
MDKPKIALFFGGNSPEHDISIITALSVAAAIDSTKYQVIPVYADKSNKFYTGVELLKRENYYLSEATKSKIDVVNITVNPINGSPTLSVLADSIFKKNRYIDFDIAMPAFHGGTGEDGAFVGLLEFLNIPYTGPRSMASKIVMNKFLTKELFKNAGINILPSNLLTRDNKEEFLNLDKYLKQVTLNYPLCVKPCNLGSSIGVNIARNEADLKAAIIEIFKIDYQILIEPYVENLIEFNISITNAFGDQALSAIEKPISSGDLLDFKTKYLNGKNRKAKLSVPSSMGMASLKRDTNPEELTQELKTKIHEYSIKAFKLISGTGAPRIDFLCDSKTGEIWLNEVNPLPGSFAYYLWEAAEPKVNFTKLLTALIDEGFAIVQNNQIVTDSIATGSNIFD